MKTTTFLAVMAMLLMLSCKKAQNVTADEKKLNLTAPSGLQIAKDIADLKTETGKLLPNPSQFFEIIDIRYAPLQTGYAAIVRYRLEDWTIGAYIVLYDVNYTSSDVGLTITLNSNKDVSGNLAPSPTKYVCQKEENCTTKCSYPVVTVNDDEGTMTIDCGCGGNCTAKKVR